MERKELEKKDKDVKTDGKVRKRQKVGDTEREEKGERKRLIKWNGEKGYRKEKKCIEKKEKDEKTDRRRQKEISWRRTENESKKNVK